MDNVFQEDVPRGKKKFSEANKSKAKLMKVSLESKDESKKCRIGNSHLH
jgi:hypothetical protein